MQDASPGILTALRPEARNLPESGIVRAMNYGRDKEGLIPLWAGEGDAATPAFICDAAYRSMQDGETFYTYQRGIPELRQALATWHKEIYQVELSPERFFVTGSGMQAVQIAVQAVAGPGDEIIIPTPAWPNYAATAGIAGARVVEVPMELTADGWILDLESLKAACGPATRAIFVNSPGNPTGWTASRGDISDILELARQKGLWIVSDEVYGRYFYDGAVAPSFLESARPDDRLLVVNTFSKNWAMTGWRIGWLCAPEEMGQVIENLIQYNSSGVAVFMQRAGIAALQRGDVFTAQQVENAGLGRDLVCDRLGPLNRVRFARPDGAFYLLFAIEGEEDTDSLVMRLIDEANIGLAPGTSFGAGAGGFLRLCFARSEATLSQAMDRLTSWIKKN